MYEIRKYYVDMYTRLNYIIFLQKDLYNKSSLLIYIYIYIYLPNFDNVTMYSIITCNLLHIFVIACILYCIM